ncbi:MAG TPA: DUF4389 domain-containing protein [Solirubrobacterales bacterium]
MYPITYEADFNAAPNRWTTFFRPILVIPWAIVMVVYLIAFLFTHFFAWIAVVITAHYPEWLYNFNSGVIRYAVRVYAWASLQTDAWPPFGLAEDSAYPIRVGFPPIAERQSRLKAFFRLVLVIPLEIVIYLGIGYLHTGAAVVAWLTIVFRGYLPEAVNGVLTYVNGFYARFAGYLAILTDDYPPIGLERAKPAPPAAAPPAPPETPPPTAA